MTTLSLVANDDNCKSAPGPSVTAALDSPAEVPDVAALFFGALLAALSRGTHVKHCFRRETVMQQRGFTEVAQ